MGAVPLDRATILDAGVALIDERGLEGFTLRALGARLGLSQMAVYHHYSNKEAIIDAMAERLLADVRLAPEQRASDPDERIVSFAVRIRAALLAHPALVPAVASRPLAETVEQRDLDDLLDTFREAGFPEASIITSALALGSTVLGLVLWESHRLGHPRALPTDPDGDQGADGGAAGPRAFTSQVVAEAWAESNFETIVRIVLRGLEEEAGIGS